MGVPPHRYVSGRRLENAKTMIATGHVSLSEIAFNCQFSSQSSFTRAFRRATGMTPAEYRRTLRHRAPEPGSLPTPALANAAIAVSRVFTTEQPTDEDGLGPYTHAELLRMQFRFVRALARAFDRGLERRESAAAMIVSQNDQDQRTLSSKSRNAVSSWTVRRNNCTVRRSLLVDARKPGRSCCCRRRKVPRSLFRKVSSSRSWPATTRSRMDPLQPLRLRKLRGDMPADELCG